MEKRLFGVFLIVYLILGIVFFVIGVCLPPQLHPHLEGFNETVQDIVPTIDPSIAVAAFTRSCFITIGGLLVLLAAYGSCSLALEKKGLLKGFGYMMLVLLTLKLVGGFALLVFAFTKMFSIEIREKVLDNFLRIKEELKLIKVQMFFEETYDCCGIDSYRDYILVHDWERFPRSCCKNLELFCNEIDKIKSDGCSHKLVDAYYNQWFPLAALCIIISAIEVIGVMATFQFLNKIKSNVRSFPEKMRSHSSSV